MSDMPGDYSHADLSPNSRLRICHMIGSLNFGGAERQVVNLLNELPANQAFVIILGEKIGPLASHLRTGIRIEQRVTRWRNFPRDIWRLASTLRRLDVHVVQTHMFWANLFGTIAGRLAGIPVIVTTEHGKNERKRRLARWAERFLISRFSDMRICVSDDIRRLRNIKDGVPQEKLCVVANGTPVRQKKRLSNQWPVVIGTIGRLIEAKNFQTLIKAAEMLRDRGMDFRLIIVGDGPERGRLEAEISSRHLQSVVELPGFAEDVQTWLEQFHIYVISSIREGQPLSLLEAMAIGLPIVATPVGGIPDTVENGKEALLVDPGDPAELAAAIDSLAGDLKLRKKLGAAARERLINDYSAAASLRRHLDIYHSVLASKKHKKLS